VLCDETKELTADILTPHERAIITKHVQTVSFQPNYMYVSTLPGKTKNNKNSRLLTALHSVQPIVSDFRIKSFSVSFFPYLLDNSFSSLLTGNISHFHEFLSENYHECNVSQL